MKVRNPSASAETLLSFIQTSVTGLSADEQDMLGELYQLYAVSLFHFANKMLNDRQSAEDAVQECFYKIGKQLSRKLLKQDKQSVMNRALLYVIVKHHCLNVLRKSKNEASYIEHLTNPKSPHFQIILFELTYAQTRNMDLQTALAEIGEEAAELLVLRFMVGLKYREVAQVLHTSVSTAKRRTAQALEKMRRSDAIQQYRGGDTE